MTKIIEKIIFWIITTSITLLTSLIYNYYSKIKKTNKNETKHIKFGLLLLLKSEIIKIYEKCAQNETCSIYEMELVEEMYRNYTKLGGNGCAKKLINKLKQFPLTPSK